MVEQLRPASRALHHQGMSDQHSKAACHSPAALGATPAGQAPAGLRIRFTALRRPALRLPSPISSALAIVSISSITLTRRIGSVCRGFAPAPSRLPPRCLLTIFQGRSPCEQGVCIQARLGWLQGRIHSCTRSATKYTCVGFIRISQMNSTSTRSPRSSRTMNRSVSSSGLFGTANLTVWPTCNSARVLGFMLIMYTLNQMACGFLGGACRL